MTPDEARTVISRMSHADLTETVPTTHEDEARAERLVESSHQIMN
jgi:hypothetical protein